MDIKKDIGWRISIAFVAVVLVFVAVMVKLFIIQQVEGNKWRELGDAMHLKEVTVMPERGSIYSEDGNILSTSVPIYDVYLDFGSEGVRDKQGKVFKEKLDSLSIGLAKVFPEKTSAEYKTLLKMVYKNEERYYSLFKKITHTQYKAMMELPFVKLGKNKSGFITDIKDKRINPYVLLANRTIGISRGNKSENVGIELSYDSVLSGQKGTRIVRSLGQTFVPVDGGEIAAINGKDVVTTLDTYMQDVAENALMNMLVGNNSLHGTAIVMETATGKIKAIANLGKQEDGTYFEDMNYGVGKATEPGSVFKLATLASLIDDGFVNNNTIVDCEGGAKSFYGLVIKDSHKGLGRVTVKDAFLRSSNVAFAKLASQYYSSNPKQFINNLHKYRLDVGTGVDIVAGTGRPIIKKPNSKSWGATTLPYMAHGYEELLTPLHLLTFYNAIANNGKLMKPYLVNEIRQYGATLQSFAPVVLTEQICKPSTIQQLQECLLAVVDSAHGTGRKVLKNNRYSIAGKTGTAVTALNNRGYNKNNKIYQSSFIGYFPANAPKYTMAVVIQNTQASKLTYGADVAGAVFKEISDRIYGRFLSNQKYVANNTKIDSIGYKFYGNSKDITSIFENMQFASVNLAQPQVGLNSIYFKGNSLQAINKTNIVKNTVPNVVGMGLKDALFLLENNGLLVTVSGKGKVVSQSINAGVGLFKNQKIHILLN
jgi:cell division protein FtsI (penicillin-binding protein 3)